jgi:hypothetical protein
MLMKNHTQQKNKADEKNKQSNRTTSFAESTHLDSYSYSSDDGKFWSGGFTDNSGGDSDIYPNFPVRDQGSCGSCYCHTATYATEYAYRIFETPSAVDGVDAYQQFSVQQCVDCSSATTSNGGCDGGFSEYAFDYWIDAYMNDETTYPYSDDSYYDNTAGSCQYSDIEPFTWTDSSTLALKVGSRTFANTSTPNRPTPDQVKAVVD